MFSVMVMFVSFFFDWTRITLEFSIGGVELWTYWNEGFGSWPTYSVFYIKSEVFLVLFLIGAPPLVQIFIEQLN